MFIQTARISKLLYSTVKPVTVDLYYDVTSPYTWFAFEALIQQKKKWNIDLKLRPVVLPAITKATGNKAPWLLPAKAQLTLKDLERNAKYFNVPLKMIPSEMLIEVFLKKGSRLPMSAVVAVNEVKPELTEDVCRALWIMLWNKGKDITVPEVITEAFSSIGMDGDLIEKIFQRMKDEDVKNILKASTNAAVNDGAFGVPTIVLRREGAEDELFFGSDRFPLIAQELGEQWLGPDTDAIGKSIRSKL